METFSHHTICSSLTYTPVCVEFSTQWTSVVELAAGESASFITATKVTDVKPFEQLGNAVLYAEVWESGLDGGGKGGGVHISVVL